MVRILLLALFTACLAQPLPLAAAEALAAVAANFARPAEQLAARFERDSGHRVRLALGSTGKLYAQIVRGGPYDLFLAADAERPARLVADGRAVRASQVTYAVGRLALIRHDDRRPSPAWLAAGDFRRLAIANPRLAPYGLAAEQALHGLGLAATLRPKLVFGENIGQAFALVATGNAEAGLVALAQVEARQHWLVPAALHAPIRQDAVLLVRGAGNPAAEGFLAYLRTDAAQAAIAAFGYGGD